MFYCRGLTDPLQLHSPQAPPARLERACSDYPFFSLEARGDTRADYFKVLEYNVLANLHCSHGSSPRLIRASIVSLYFEVPCKSLKNILSKKKMVHQAYSYDNADESHYQSIQ